MIALLERFPFTSSLAGLLAYGLAFPPLGLWPLAWIGLVPLFYNAGRGHLSARRVFCLALGAFSLLHLLLYHWICNFLPLGMPFVVIALSLWYAAGTTLFAVLARGRDRLRLPLAVACFLLAEAARSSGEISLTWCLAGHSQADALPILQSAAVWGVWGISACLVLANALLAEGLHRLAASAAVSPKRRLSGYPLAALAIPLLLFVAGLPRLADPPETADSGHSVSLVQTGANPFTWNEDYATQSETLFRLAGEAAAAKPALVVFPETALPYNVPGYFREYRRLHGIPSAAGFRREPDDASFLTTAARAMLLAQKHDAAFLLTANRFEETGPGTNGYNTAILLEPQLPVGDTRQVYDKIRLVPFGEYLPWPSLLSFLTPLLAEADVSVFASGTNLTVFSVGETRFSVLICYEDWFEDLAADFFDAGARALCNVTSDARFASPIAEAQHLTGSRFAAVACGLPVYRAANTGVTGFVDPAGRLRAALPRSKPGVLTVPWRTARAGDAPTLFVRHGRHLKGWLVAFSLLTVLLGITEAVRKRFSK